LGRTGIEVPPLCFGGNVFGWTADAATSFHILDRLAEAGLGFIDTADQYSRWVPGHVGGESETIIGQWLKARGRRDDVVIATKVGAELDPDRKGLSARRIAQAIDDSLRRLQTDHVDLYQSHFDDPTTPFEETLEAYDRLIKAGKVRAIGASNLSAERLAEALAVSARTGLPRYETLQPRYNLIDRDSFEGPLQDLCLREGLGVIPYYALAAGFLTGKYRSAGDAQGSARKGMVERYMNDRGRRILAALDRLAVELAAKPGQVALAWLMRRPAVTAPIASATSLQQLEELIGATELELDGDAMRRLDEASAG
jgi:aryl-alcohol dehydrogenase-like predicted oxidoreductase